MAGPESKNYWLQRLAQAIEDATNAPGERSRLAYIDLARHYWSMHLMIHGRTPTPLPVSSNTLSPETSNSPVRWAA